MTSHFVNSLCCSGADNGGNKSREYRKNKGVSEGGKGFGGIEKLLIPSQAEALKESGAVCRIKREENESEDRYIKNTENERDIDSGGVFHTIIPPSSESENLFIIVREIRISTIITREIAAPTLRAPVTNCLSIVSPISSNVPPPSFCDM